VVLQVEIRNAIFLRIVSGASRGDCTKWDPVAAVPAIEQVMNQHTQLAGSRQRLLLSRPLSAKPSYAFNQCGYGKRLRQE
jgi:hypothetical protein